MEILDSSFDDAFTGMQDIIAAVQCRAIEPPCSRRFMTDWARDFNAWQSIQHLGFAVQFNTFSSLIVLTPVRDHHRGGLGKDAVNGAVISGVLDGAIATIGFCHFPGSVCGTVHLSIDILRPVFTDSIYAYGIGCSRNRRSVFCEAELYDDDLKLCAKATGIVVAAGSK